MFKLTLRDNKEVMVTRAYIDRSQYTYALAFEMRDTKELFRIKSTDSELCELFSKHCESGIIRNCQMFSEHLCWSVNDDTTIHGLHYFNQ
jgi:hypothetical protein